MAYGNFAMIKNTGGNTTKIKRATGLCPPWPKGKTGNPNGRPRGVRNWALVLKEQFESGDISQEQLMTKLVALADKGDIRALEMVMDRMDGKANQNVNLKGQSIVQLIQEGHKSAQDAKTEVSGEKKKR